MKLRSLASLLLGMSMLPSVALATDRPTVFDFEYTFPASPTAPRVNIADYAVQWFVINVIDPPTEAVTYLEFEINALSHASPMDLRVELLDPTGDLDTPGNGIVIMDEAGWQHSISNQTLIFNDKFPAALPHGEKAGAINSGFFSQDGPGLFSNYYGSPLPEGGWYVVITDGAVGDVGSFESVTLRGTVVPEPATLTLLALGAVAVLRRRRA